MKIIYNDLQLRHLFQINSEIQELQIKYDTFGKSPSVLAERNELINMFYQDIRSTEGNILDVPKDMRTHQKEYKPYVNLFNSLIMAAAKEREQQRKMRKPNSRRV